MAKAREVAKVDDVAKVGDLAKVGEVAKADKLQDSQDTSLLMEFSLILFTYKMEDWQEDCCFSCIIFALPCNDTVDFRLMAKISL